MKTKIIKFLFELYWIRFLLGVFFIVRGNIRLVFGKKYYGLQDLCWVYRVSEVIILQNIVFGTINKYAQKCYTSNRNIIREDFLKTKVCKKNAERYSLSNKGDLDFFRDIIVLKSPAKNEKGVILLAYGETYDALISFFDLDKILENYYIVLEMSWSGTCDPTYLMFINPKNKLIVQTPEQKDYDFLYKINTNLIPLNKMGSGDWTDIERFNFDYNNVEKKFDVGMIANWLKTKNHIKLFMALKKIKNRPLKILLLGFPISGRTKEDIIREFNSVLKNDAKNFELTIKERIPHEEMNQYYAQTKVTLLLGRKEGFNKAVMESLFCNTPIIVYDKHRGGAKEQVCNETGLLSSFKDLHENIVYMVDNYNKYNTRTYIEKTSGSIVSTRRLNDKLKQLSSDEGNSWDVGIEEKVNNPNLEYIKHEIRENYKDDYDFIKSCFNYFDK